MTGFMVQGRAATAALLFFLCGCTQAQVADHSRPRAVRPGSSAVVDEVQQRTFRWFWETTNPHNGLVPDRHPTPSFSSVAAIGFGLTTYPIGVERGWITDRKSVV